MARLFTTFCSLIFICCTLPVRADDQLSPEAARDRIAVLREAQKNAFAWQYYNTEQHIAQIHQSHNHTYVTNTWYLYRKLLQHCLPPFVWQLFALAFLLMILFTKGLRRITRIFLTLFFMVAGFFAILSYYEALQKIYIVPQSMVMYIGPGVQFPQRTTLNVLDEVTINKEQDNWKLVDIGGIQGWISYE